MPFLFKTVEKKFKYFHVTPVFIGEKVNLKLAVPVAPFEDDHGYVIEDDITPRACVSSSIEGCIAALGEACYDWAVYGSNDLKTFKPNSNCSIPNYGIEFSWLDYAIKKGLDNSDDNLRRQFLKGCVPDADHTGELWLTEDSPSTEVYFLGTINDDKKIKTSEQYYELTRKS